MKNQMAGLGIGAGSMLIVAILAFIAIFKVAEYADDSNYRGD